MATYQPVIQAANAECFGGAKMAALRAISRETWERRTATVNHDISFLDRIKAEDVYSRLTNNKDPQL